MNFPNALDGIKKIRTAEILGIIVALLGAVGGGLVLGAVKSANSVENAVNAGGSAIIGGGLIATIAGILAIIAFIMRLVGYSRAGKDEPSFKTALYVAVAGIVLSVLSSVFAKNATISAIFKVLIDVCQPIATYLVITGIMNLAGKLGNTEMKERGTKLFKIIIALYVIAIIIEIISAIFGKNTTTAAISGVLGIVAAVLSIVTLVLYLGYLKRAVQMLE